MIEEWREIPGYDGRYQASNLGRVKSVARTQVMSDGRIRPVKERILSTSKASKYQTLSLYTGPKTRKSPTLHSVIASAFLGPRPNGMVVCHNDGNRDNNRADNLRYDTQSANVFDSVGHGAHPEAKLTHCKRGHPFDGHNLVERETKRGKIRRCRQCIALYSSIRNAKMRDARLNPAERKVLQDLQKERDAAMLAARTEGATK